GGVHLIAGHAVDDHVAAEAGNCFLRMPIASGQLRLRVKRTQMGMISEQRERVLESLQKPKRNIPVLIGKILEGTPGVVSCPRRYPQVGLHFMPRFAADSGVDRRISSSA